MQNSLELAHQVELLERTPATLRALFTDLSASWIICDEGPGTFSAHEGYAVSHGVHTTVSFVSPNF
jgi:hypothetical protein